MMVVLLDDAVAVSHSWRSGGPYTGGGPRWKGDEGLVKAASGKYLEGCEVGVVMGYVREEQRVGRLWALSEGWLGY